MPSVRVSPRSPVERRGTTITYFAPSPVRRAVSSALRQPAPLRVSSPRHGSPASRRAPPTPTAGSICSPSPAADRAPSLLRITAACSRDSRTASHTTFTPGRRRTARAAIRKARGEAGRGRGPCGSLFSPSIIVAGPRGVLGARRADRQLAKLHLRSQRAAPSSDAECRGAAARCSGRWAPLDAPGTARDRSHTGHCVLRTPHALDALTPATYVRLVACLSYLQPTSSGSRRGADALVRDSRATG